MNRKFCASLVAGLVLLNLNVIQGAPIVLNVIPRGTNQVEFKFGPVVPGVPYQVLVRTNSPEGHWMFFGRQYAMSTSNTTINALCELGGEGALKGLTVASLKRWSFVAGCVEDSDGDGLPDLYEDLATHTDPNSGQDGYSDPDEDEWSNLEEMARNTDPLRTDPPTPPKDFRLLWFPGYSQLTWRQEGNLPDYFEIQRTDRIALWNTNRVQPRVSTNISTFMRHTNTAAFMRRTNMFQNRTNLARPSYLNRTNSALNLPGRSQMYNSLANRPLPQSFWDGAYLKASNLVTVITNPPQIVARVEAQHGLHSYQWSDTNGIFTFRGPAPLYLVRAHFTTPAYPELRYANVHAIRAAIQPLGARQMTNGWALTLTNPIPGFRYLLLVRDRKDTQWRAGGYFVPADKERVWQMQADLTGNMISPQSPIALPEMKYGTSLLNPEFIAGPAYDNDGDGLPDVYEVVVTKTDPLATDTGRTGVIDGYKEMTSDGWSNLEKFRRRANPLKAFHPPDPVVLTGPALNQVLSFPALRCDLPYQQMVEVHIPGMHGFQVLHRGYWWLFPLSGVKDAALDHVCFDLRISWVVPRPQAREEENDLSGFSGLSGLALMRPARSNKQVVALPDQAKILAARRSEIENYAATNKIFATAMNYFIATIEGHKPAAQPPGLSIEQLEAPILKVFPCATNILDQPIRFYGMVVDESGRPIPGMKAHLDWTGFLLQGTYRADVVSDSGGRFAMTNGLGTQLSVSFQDTNYYGSVRNRANGSFQYVDALRESFKSDKSHPVIYYFHKKGTSAKSLITSQYGVYSSFAVQAPLDGTPVEVDLLQRKTGKGPLEISQRKPEPAVRKDATSWSFRMKIADGGFVTNDDEFPYEAPEAGYQQVLEFKFRKGESGWGGAIDKKYYIKFGNPEVYGNLQVVTSMSGGISLTYSINPDGSRNLEP